MRTTLSVLGFAALVVVVANFFWTSPPLVQKSIWKSRTHPLSVEVIKPFRVVGQPTDRPDEVMVGFIQDADGSSYVIQVSYDTNRKQVIPKAYYDTVVADILSRNKENKLIRQDDIAFHGAQFHLIEFKMIHAIWGPLKINTFIHCAGNRVISVQMLFPWNDDEPQNGVIPPALKELDQQVKLFEQEFKNAKS